MPRSSTYQRDPEAAAQKRADAMRRLEEGIASVTTSDGFRDWLRMASRFHTYSFNNQILIWMQRPDARRVAGFRAWLELGRHVRKGAKGIQIFVPFVRRNTDADTDADAGETHARPDVRFGISYVFDVADTEGDDLPTLHYAQTTGETCADLLDRACAYAAARGLALAIEDRPSKAEGYYDPAKGEIWIRPTLDTDGRAAVLVHELAHVLDHAAHRDAGISFDYVNHRGDRETVAEAVAYIVADHFGLDTGSATFGYVAGWAQDVSVFKARMGEIQKLSDALIVALEAADDAAAA